MYIVEKLKLNRFQLVCIPSNTALFARFGMSMSGNPVYSGDNPAEMPSSKVDQLAAIDAANERYIREEDYQAYLKSVQSQPSGVPQPTE